MILTWRAGEPQAHSAITVTCTKSEWGPAHVETDTFPKAQHRPCRDNMNCALHDQVRGNANASHLIPQEWHPPLPVLFRSTQEATIPNK